MTRTRFYSESDYWMRTRCALSGVQPATPTTAHTLPGRETGKREGEKKGKQDNPNTKPNVTEHNHDSLQDKLRIIRQCACDPDFKPNQLDPRFRNWIIKEITTYYLLTDKGKINRFSNFEKKICFGKARFLLVFTTTALFQSTC